MLQIRQLGLSPYQDTWQKMRVFTDTRDAYTPDELWLVEHPPIYTQGQNGKAEHLLSPGNIPVVQTDRGGQITYHGPGQLVAYSLIDLKRLDIGVRHLVRKLEKIIIALLAEYSINAAAREDAPGVYVDGAKICSIGLRVRRGCSYHGIAFNINMDLDPFSRINPCGMANLAITQLSDLGGPKTIGAVTPRFIDYFKQEMGYNIPMQSLEK